VTKQILTALTVRSTKAGAARREIPDAKCAGLYLVVQSSGAKSWAFRYRHAGRSRKLTIGAAIVATGPQDEPGEVILGQPATLAGARKLAMDAHQKVARGIDPASEKVERKRAAHRTAALAEMTDQDTIEAVGEAFLQKHVSKLRPETCKQYSRIVRSVIAAWRGRSVQAIRRRDVLDLLDKIVEAGKPIAANRTLRVIGKLYAWAISRDITAASPCIGIKSPSPEHSRDRILNDDELRRVWRAADAIGWPFGALVELLILTGQRRDEVGEMRWSEISLDKGLWEIPAARAKNNRKHEVPLSAPALAILAGLPRIAGRDFAFTANGETAFSSFSGSKRKLDTAMLRLAGDGIPHWTLHDLRRTCASGMAKIGINLPVIEKVLNHASGSFGGIVGIYQRHTYAEEKRAALDAWGRYVTALITGETDNVIALAEARRRGL